MALANFADALDSRSPALDLNGAAARADGNFDAAAVGERRRTFALAGAELAASLQLGRFEHFAARHRALLEQRRANAGAERRR